MSVCLFKFPKHCGDSTMPTSSPASNSGRVLKKKCGLATWSASKMQISSEPGMGTSCETGIAPASPHPHRLRRQLLDDMGCQAKKRI